MRSGHKAETTVRKFDIFALSGALPKSFHQAIAMNDLVDGCGDAGRKELAIECFEKTLNLIATGDSRKRERAIPTH
jgi:hypothetical protein